MKKSLSLVGALAAASLMLAACGGGDKAASGDQSGDQSGTDAKQSASGESYKIGVAQFVTHPSLDQAAAGFKEALDESGAEVTYEEQNANADQTTVASIAGSMDTGDYDLILTIATPMAQAVAKKVTETPVLFTAVTEPVDAELVDSWETPGANVTGTSDLNPVGEQLDLIKQVIPDAKTVGVIYSPGEANSLVQVNLAKEAAKDLGLELVEAQTPTSADIAQAVETLSDVDAIYVPTDNVVVSGLDSVLKFGEDNKIPVFGAEGDSVEKGCVGTFGLNYFDLGKQTGEMALRILQGGEDPAVMAVETQAEPKFFFNKKGAEAMGVEIPAKLLDEAPAENIYE